MSGFGIKGRFRCTRLSDGDERVFDNTITTLGLYRILELMGGLSSGSWDKIRMTALDQSIFVEKNASFEREFNLLRSSAIFTSNELVFETRFIQMYANGVKVAEADANLPAGQTYSIVREDVVDTGAI